MNLLKNNNVFNLISGYSRKIFINKKVRSVIYFIIIALIFSLTYRQAPLFQSNQHTKFLHGYAKAGYGYLKNDWLANTIDPLPEFSFLAYLTVKFLNEHFFYFYYVLILGVFIYCILKISGNLFFNDSSQIVKIFFFTIIITLHSTLLDSYFFKFFKYRITELLMEKGVAEQYLLGSYFQPCVFGVFLLLSIFLFLKNKPFLSIIFLAVPSIFHSAYIFSSGILTLSYMIIILNDEKNLRKALLIGLFSLILVLPVLIYNFVYLGPTSSEMTNKALDIIVNTRIPQHTDTKRWINIDAMLKLTIVITAAVMVRKNRIFLIIFIPLLVSVLSTIIQIFIKNDLIAFLAPWRESVWLVPLSTSIIAGYLINFTFNKIKIFNILPVRRFLYIFCGLIIVAHLTYGMNGTIKQFDEYLNKDHGPMMNFVKENKNPDDVYLIPPDMMEFRLNTGVPILITYKSHPYKDVELLEWYERVKIAEDFYYKTDKNNISQKIKFLNEKYKITKVLIPKKISGLKTAFLEELYSDSDYSIYEIK